MTETTKSKKQDYGMMAIYRQKINQLCNDMSDWLDSDLKNKLDVIIVDKNITGENQYKKIAIRYQNRILQIEDFMSFKLKIIFNFEQGIRRFIELGEGENWYLSDIDTETHEPCNSRVFNEQAFMELIGYLMQAQNQAD